MGAWSRLAGDTFLDWLDAPAGSRWLDVGCGNGAFTALVAERCAPASVDGVDPSEAQLAFARARPCSVPATYARGVATALPYDDARFDVATFALVLHFLPDVAPALAEAVRVVRPGGTIAAYTWDLPGGGFPPEPVLAAMAAFGAPEPRHPNVDASRLDVARSSWIDAGLVDVHTHVIPVTRTFANFDAFWAIMRTGPPIVPGLATLSPSDVEAVRRRVRERMPPEPDGRVVATATANAVRGTRPG